ncbi:VPLPA-CTERM sorting domain-containing protein [Rhodobacteraceae bacterium NNCM2]|nr:VPLPA-CTERM sorting domain-containing protein [Coraliihabitans acroporae]
MKKFKYLLAAGAVFAATEAAAVPTNGLLGYYTFDSSDASDSSGNGADGTLGANSSFAVGQGVDGNTAAQFDTAGSSDFINVPINLNPSFSSSATIAGWFLVDPAAPVNRGRVGVTHDNGGYDRGISLDTRTGTSPVEGTEAFSAFAGTSAGVVRSDEDFNRPTDLGEWFFVAVVFDQGVTNGSALYVANQSLSSFSVETFTASTGNGASTATIGGVGTDEWLGLIDNVGFYNRALSQQEIENFAFSSAGLSTVPLPAAAPMLLLGLAGLYAGTRRRRNRA